MMDPLALALTGAALRRMHADPAAEGTLPSPRQPSRRAANLQLVAERDREERDRSAVRIDRLEVVRGENVVLRGISLAIAAGHITGLLGPSGSGKTTLMRAIVGVQRVRAGTIEVFGLPAGSPQLRRRVGYVTQAPSLYGDLTARENLDYFARVAGAQRERVDEVLRIVDLGRRANRPVRSLSGGERSRASLAVALLGEPELLVLDEPTVGLDPVLRSELWATFHALAERGTTLLVSSHSMEEADESDSLILLREGRVIAEAEPDELRRRTGQPDLGSAFLELVRAA